MRRVGEGLGWGWHLELEAWSSDQSAPGRVLLEFSAQFLRVAFRASSVAQLPPVR